MNTPEIVGLIAWAPFVFAFLAIGIVTLIKGYKKGVIVSSINLGLTLVSAFLALLLSKLLSGIDFGIIGLLEGLWDEESIISAIAESAVPALLSLVIFPIIFVILSPTSKAILRAILKDKLPKAEKVGLKLGGLGVALVDAIVFITFLTLPIYGTLSLVDRAVDVVPAVSAKAAEKEEFEILAKATENIPTKITNIPPFSTVYDSLMTFEFAGANVSIGKTVRLGASLVSELVEMKDKSPEDYGQNEIDFLDDAEELIVDNRVFCMIISTVASESLENNKTLSEYASSITPEGVSEDLGAVFDVLRSAIKNQVIADIAENKEKPSKLLSSKNIIEGEFIYDFTEAINKTEGMRTLKKSFLSFVSDSIGDGIDASFDVIGGKVLTEDEIRAEGDSFLLIIRGIGKAVGFEDSDKVEDMIPTVADIIEGLARHPAIGVDSAVDVIASLVGDREIPLLESEAVKNNIKDILSDAVSKPVGSDEFGKFLSCLLNTTKVFDTESLKNGDTEAIENLLNSDPDALKNVAGLISTELVSGLGVSEELGEAIVSLADGVLNKMAELKDSGVDTKKEAEAISSFVSAVTYAENVSKKEASDMLKTALDSEIISSAVVLLSEKEEDSLGAVSEQLGKNVKNEISSVLKDYYNSNKNEETLEKVNAYAEFFGVKKIA